MSQYLAGKSELRDDANKNSNSSDNICGSSAITEVHPIAHAEESSILQGQLEYVFPSQSYFTKMENGI